MMTGEAHAQCSHDAHVLFHQCTELPLDVPFVSHHTHKSHVRQTKNLIMCAT